jgi:hypothetical protein
MYKLYKFQDQVIGVFKNEGNFTICIPFDNANTDYQQYLKFLEEGGQPLPAEEQ